MNSEHPASCAMLAIGDEILSGRTKDKNIGHFAEIMTLSGIELREVRIVPDDGPLIAESVNALRERYTFVVTSGGIGPTHDDITADSVAMAFGLPVTHHPEAMRRLAEHYEQRQMAFTDARKRMARTPEGAGLIDNPVSVAPGFTIGNVHVLAGVPHVFQAMLDNLLPSLPKGLPVESRSVPCPVGEGDIGGPLAELAKAHDGVAIGSYPRFSDGRYTNEIVIRSRDAARLADAERAVRALIKSFD